MKDSIDEGRLRNLMEESEDLQSDALKSARTDLGDYVEAARAARADQERSGWAPAVAVAGAVGAATLLTATPAFAQGDMNVSALQTAASLENLAVFTYKTALTLPFIGGSAANGVVKAFAMKTMSQHAEHAAAFNAAATKLGGKAQTGNAPTYEKVVLDAVPGIKGAGDVVGLAIKLETIATQTYVKNVSQVTTKELRQLFSSVAGVEAQHLAILTAVQALLPTPTLIALPPDAAKLPGVAGSIAFPDAFIKTDMAAPVEEGAVK